MSVHVQWDNEEQTIILWSFVGRWTWGEYEDALNAASALLDQVEHTVDYIYDVRRMNILPPDVVTRFKAKYLKQPPKTGRFVAVGVDHNLRLVWNTFTDLPYAHHLRVEYADTLEEAREILQGTNASE